MASSGNLASIEPWTFPSSFADSWISEACARDTEALTRVLQKSISDSFLNTDSPFPFLSVINPDTSLNPTATPTPSESNLSASDLKTESIRQRTANPPPTGKVSKRKPRHSKRSQTTFITADPAHFRQMVQQVTGIRFGNGQMCPSPILKLAPQRPRSQLPNGTGPGCLSTLDTSAFSLDNQQPSSGAVVGSSLLPFQSSVVAEGVASTSANLDCDSFPSFPTLESWNV